ncbi:cellulose biosynthesis protein BcsQ [Legionella fallonii]|uniref:Cellulose synthase operon protein YhjQ n=1 Tax=Legionella fallonii LLAP-10 TaxID=1212491 RepID=A0A098G9M9_9GAMM|nr:cellulose biosynthesis protein BcsQ [Legionella fallonii]CEG58692.1 Cellulose synthase operon protein YhjQ [Legionella fallonii LLAP-10]
MPVIGLQGVRGGSGTTSLTAGLAWSLQKLGASVLAIDCSPDNMLRLYFNMPFTQKRGWARAMVDGIPWQESAMSYTKLLDFVPFGTISKTEQLKLETQPKMDSAFWQSQLTLTDLIAHKSYDWILLDLPTEHLTSFAHYGLSLIDCRIRILNANMSCHVGLHQQELPGNCYFLVNKYNSSYLLQKNLMQLWRQALSELLPLIVHSDEAITESLAVKQPPGEYGANSLAAKDLMALANWCCASLVKQIS